MQKILIHPDFGRFFYDSGKCEKGELGRLRERGYVDQPPELDDTPDGAIVWEGGVPASKDVDAHRSIEKGQQARRANERYMFEFLDKVANWLATENEFTIPPDLKSFVSAWQGRKPKKG